MGSSLKELDPDTPVRMFTDIFLITAGGSCDINMHCMCSFWIFLPHNVSRHECVN